MTKRALILLVAALVTATAADAKRSAVTITGAGSTFVSPLVSVWTPALGSA
jgi:ABC-type phosphate transport system substrate-binding protein